MHQVGAPGRCKLSIVTMLLDQQVGGSPNVEIGDHPRGRSNGDYRRRRGGNWHTRTRTEPRIIVLTRIMQQGWRV
jgi:hypothetical protein